MESSEEEDIIDAFFNGRIIGKKNEVKPTLKSDYYLVKKEDEKQYTRKIEEKSEINSVERKLFAEFLNARVEEIDGSLGIEEVDEKLKFCPEDVNIYKRYEFNIAPQRLPILEKHDEIISTIQRNNVIILKAETGCGKSSQVPQYILEDCAKRNIRCNIIITQPKKISAESLASRVSFERKCKVGSLCGYQIGLDKKMDKVDTRILYCTTGVFLQKLIHYKSLEEWTHVIIDEIHERDLDMDMVLLIIRRLMVATKSKTKIILMSATLDCDKIADYFRIIQKPPIINLRIKKPFPVKIHYLDELEHLGPSKDYINMEEPDINRNMIRFGVDLIEFLFKNENAESFLIFLPGIFEIESFQRELQAKREFFNVKDFRVFILHSSIPLTNIKGLYDISLKNKIVLATNIAESSITIPGIQIIIDYCLTKYLEVDSASSLTQLKLAWASKKNTEQRAGRTGRTSTGKVIRMLYEEQYESLPNEGKAEMQRMSLETAVLKIKNFQMGRPADILAIALDPPERSAIVDAILKLKEIGALTRFNKKEIEFDFLDGNLTFTGDIMSKLPIDIRLSKLIILGYVFSVLNECIVIAAALSRGPIFKHENTINAFETKLNHDTTSDLCAVLNAYIKYNEWLRNNRNQVIDGIEEKWCNNQMLNYKNVKEMSGLINDIKDRLKQFSILTDDFRYTTEEKIYAIKICIAGAFYPNFYTFGGEIPRREEFKQVHNRNLCSSVFFQTKLQLKNGHLYEKQFRDMLFDAEIVDCSDDAFVTFDSGSKKVFIQFNNLRNDCEVKMPGEVKLEVHRALKYRSLKKYGDLKLYVMNSANEEIYAPPEEVSCLYNKDLVSSDLRLKAKFNIYPNFSLKPEEKNLYLCGEITHIVSPSKFYFQPRKAISLMEKLKSVIGFNLQKAQHIEEKIDNDRIMVQHNNQFKRGQILEYSISENIHQVLLIDYGEVIKCTIEDFYTACAKDRQQRQDLLKDFFKIPALCYECKLAKIQPKAIQQYGWTKTAINEFKDIVRVNMIQLELYAFNIYDKIASVEVFIRTHQNSPLINVNDKLVNIGLATYSNESYTYMISKTLNDNFESMKYAIHKENSSVDYPSKFLSIKCEIDGPFNPLSSTGRLQNITRTVERDILIDPLSINCTLIDPFPYDGIKKLLVASSKSLTKKNKSIMLRQTTMMPASKGLSSILILIFSPIAQIRSNKDNNRYTSILAGLGCDFTAKPYYAEHDCLMRTDIEIDDEDINLINSLRNEMSILMQQKLGENFKYYQNPRNVILKSRSHACSILLKIIRKERLQLGENYEDNFDWSFSKKKEREHYRMFPIHDFPKLNKFSKDSIKFMIHHFKDLEQKAKCNFKDEMIECMACNEPIETLIDLKNHLLTVKHSELKTKYENINRDM